MALKGSKELAPQAPLRERAEKALKGTADGGANLSHDDALRMVHDLRVHEIELQMQNEELRRAEVELTEAHDRLRELYDGAPVGYLTLGTDAVIHEANLTAAKYLGVERSELIGTEFTAHLRPESQDDFYLFRRRLQSGEAPCECELVLRRKDGGTFVSELKGVAQKTGGLCLCSMSDITERRRAEQALRESQQDLNRAQAVAHVGSWRLSACGKELQWSDEIHRIFGITKGTPLTYDTFLQCVHPEDRLAVDTAWRAALHGVSYDIEHRILVGDAVKWVHERAELEFDKDGQLLGGFGTSEDITHRKEAEEKLRQLNVQLERRVAERTAELSESEAMFRTLAEESPNMIFISRGGRLVYANPLCGRMTGIDAELLESGQFEALRLFSPDSVQRVGMLFENSPVGGEGAACEASLLGGDRKPRPVLVSARRIIFGGEPAIFATLTDLTERKRAERVLERHRSALGHLASRVASAQDDEQRRIAEGLHDGVAQLLVASTFKLAALQSSAAGEKSAIAEVQGLLDQALAEIRSLVFELSAATLSRLGLGKALEELTEALGARHGVRFRLKIAGRERHLPGRAATILFKATRELMFNVAKHAGVTEATVAVAWTSRGIRIVVKDKGEGFRVDALGGRRANQSLGLLNIEERMRSIGGRVTIKAQPGEGAAISLFLRVPDTKATPPAPK